MERVMKEWDERSKHGTGYILAGTIEKEKGRQHVR